MHNNLLKRLPELEQLSSNADKLSSELPHLNLRDKTDELLHRCANLAEALEARVTFYEAVIEKMDAFETLLETLSSRVEDLKPLVEDVLQATGPMEHMELQAKQTLIQV
ncbi:unnamed protein product, partial [Dibothriocephalus latus]